MSEIRCSVCGKFCKGNNYYIPYGCADPEAPEPFDEKFLCSKCSKQDYKEWLIAFRNGRRSGNYVKSNGEIKASKKCELVYLNEGIGVLGSKNKWENAHRYITLKRYNELKDLPYWGWCPICGNKNAGGYCSNKECEKSFNLKAN